MTLKALIGEKKLVLADERYKHQQEVYKPTFGVPIDMEAMKKLRVNIIRLEAELKVLSLFARWIE